MSNFIVTVTGTWDMDIEANSPDQAEELAYKRCLEDGIDVELMNLEFQVLGE
jgi:hypothetical protein